jgi:L-ribulose-5-phosphate 3-epimerase
MPRIGFMQGRLSPQIDGKIQAFPWPHWEMEFTIAGEARFECMEWTLDADRLHENPLMLPAGQARIRELAASSGVRVNSLTGDCFMQEPFWKAPGHRREPLLADLAAVLEACSAVGVSFVVIPLVDNGRLENNGQRDSLIEGLLPQSPTLARRRMAILFESDFAAQPLANLMSRFPVETFGVNYDIGNSAALGFDAQGDLRAYGSRVRNVHVKDRLLGGTTVPLGTGAADFPKVFRELARVGYRGDFILQTARARDGHHLDVLVRYREMVSGWIADSRT